MNAVVPGLMHDKAIRRVDEAQDLSEYSLVALENMYDYQTAKRARLDRHHINLNVYLNYERDLYDQMKLARRMAKVGRNIETTNGRIKRLRAEILSRRLRMENTRS